MEIVMPALSPTMEKGTLAKWLVERGDRISPGQLLAEIETDKATMELEAFDSGIITGLLIAPGTEDVPVGTVIATLDTEADGDAAPVAGDPPALMEAQSQPQTLPAKNPPVPAVAGASASESSDGAIDVSPLAARLARAVGRDLAGVRGSGPAGRILKRDIIADAPSILVPDLPDMSPVAAPHFAVRTEAPHESVRLSAMRKVIAKRLAESKRTIPHFYLSINCRLDALLGLRGDLNRELSHRGIKLSVTDFLVRAFAVALERVPDANVQFADDALLRFSRVDLSLAVAVDGGLVTPVIRDAGGKSLTAIAGEAQRLVGLARQGGLSPEDYQGGTASLSNLGMFGVDAIGPVINPPQAVILGIGASEKRVVVVDGEAAIATVLTATASFDHRAIDGAAGAELMAAFRAVVEAPMELLV